MSERTAAEIGKALGEVLSRDSYDEKTVRELVRVDNLDFGRGLAAVRLRPTGSEPLGLLVRLFLAADSLDPDVAAAALAPVPLAELAAAGVVEHVPDGVRALVRLDPVDGLVVASDSQRRGERFPPDHVISVGPASRTLASVTTRAACSTALDLCCGSGVQALLAARHCETVIGTDLNPRALELAALSAALSGVENVAWLQGDLFEPVRGQQFDLVVSNPPFVVSPGEEFMYRDGGRHGDELSRHVVTGMIEALNDGGFGHLLCSWVNRDGEDWAEQPRRWLDGSGTDAVILRLDTESPETYAIGWTSTSGSTPDEAIARAGDWVGYYRGLEIANITTGAIVVRRRNGTNWVAAEDLIAAGWDGGKQVARMFAGSDALDGPAGDRALLALRPVLPAEVRLVERWQGDVLERARLTADGGLQLLGRITPPGAARLLRALDGTRTIAGAAADANVPPAELEAALPSLAALVRRGYLDVAT